jgi:hypothetical protein
VAEAEALVAGEAAAAASELEDEIDTPELNLEARLGTLMASHRLASQDLMASFAPLTYQLTS